MTRRKRVLFVAEDVTLAQVVRLAQLARGLDPRCYDVHFACARFDPMIFAGLRSTQHPIYTVDRARVLRAAERGMRLYDERVLARYVGEELALFRALQPDLVIGDLRVSLCVSAPHAGIPYAALINAYWSRHLVRDAFPVPDHPLMSVFGEAFVARYFPQALPRVLAYFAEPVNRLRRRYGLAPIGDFIDVLTFADRVLFPDVPWLTPLHGQPAHHVFLGPVHWAPDVPLPTFRSETAGAPIYVTLGSSGRVDRLPRVLAGLAGLGRPLWVATADRTAAQGAQNVVVSPYLPGDQASGLASLVVCNGGSSTAYQALAAGRPVLGIASNLDQFLAMDAITARGAGRMLRARSVTEASVEQAARALLEEAGYREAAAQARRELATYDSRRRFADEVARLTCSSPTAATSWN